MIAETLTEDDWATAVEDTFDLLGWVYIHHRPARRTKGRWVTPTSGSGAKGWPDYFCVRDDRALAIELKRAGNKPSQEQNDWIARLRCAGIEAHVVTMPGDWEFFQSLTARDPQQLTLTSNSTGAAWVPLTGVDTA